MMILPFPFTEHANRILMEMLALPAIDHRKEAVKARYHKLRRGARLDTKPNGLGRTDWCQNHHRYQAAGQASCQRNQQEMNF